MSVSASILVVEDSPTQAERLRHLLEAHGYQVQAAGDGRSALAAARESRPALVVADVLMPDMDGYELCAAIKADDALRDVPVILVTSLAEPHDVIRSLQCGADNFVRKPYDDEYLLARVRSILEGRERRRDTAPRAGVEVYLAGERHFITAERQQILDFLLSTYEEIAQINEELAAKNAELESRQAALEAALRELDAERERAQGLANVNRAVLDATKDGIALVDDRGETLLSNAALDRIAASLPGLRPEAGLAETAEALASLAADPDGYRDFLESLRGETDREEQYELELPELRRSFRIVTAPVRDEAGARLGRIVVLHETTAERDAERLKSELVATVSHELRTPLVGILGFAELLQQRRLDEEKRRRYLETIYGEARRLSDLIDDFLDLQRIEAGDVASALEPVDLGEVLRHTVNLLSESSPAHMLTLDAPDGELLVLGDRERLAQLVTNLLSNAVKYSPGGGPVETTARLEGGWVYVSVRDEGIGIPADQQELVFERFFRADSTDTRRIGGTGLGLAICREIVAAHGGEIDFESVEGEGSTFWFRLPAASRGGAPASRS